MVVESELFEGGASGEGPVTDGGEGIPGEVGGVKTGACEGEVADCGDGGGEGYGGVLTYVSPDVDIKGNINVKTRTVAPQPAVKPLAQVKNIIGVSSGKGGVGKSTVAANLAVALAREGYKVGLLDADIFGPSMPKMFGVEDAELYIHKVDDRELIIPLEKYGVKILSIGFLVDKDAPVLWRGLEQQYTHPIIREVGEVARKVGGHGGMDYIMDYRLVYCLRNGLPLDMDVYDLAEWCALSPLSEISIENGNAPVEYPDFTRGAWNKVSGFRHAFKDSAR